MLCGSVVRSNCTGVKAAAETVYKRYQSCPYPLDGETLVEKLDLGAVALNLLLQRCCAGIFSWLGHAHEPEPGAARRMVRRGSDATGAGSDVTLACIVRDTDCNPP